MILKNSATVRPRQEPISPHWAEAVKAFDEELLLLLLFTTTIKKMRALNGAHQTK